MEQPIYLYDLPRGSKIKAESHVGKKKVGDTLTFHHTDGMYSYCTVDGTEPVIVAHLYIMTRFTKNDDGSYTIHEESLVKN
jgi:hypothetical protein